MLIKAINSLQLNYKGKKTENKPISVVTPMNLTSAEQNMMDIITISPQMQEKIDFFKNGLESMETAIEKSNQQIRSMARERLNQIREYLSIITHFMPADKREAAHEAARMSKEIRSLTRDFIDTYSYGEDSTFDDIVKTEIESFVSDVKNVFKQAKNIITNYLIRRKKKGDDEEIYLKREISATEDMFRTLNF
ncbi:MAG: hypothetical protein HQK76_12390 [Desulfobacterales bacterium]|nr:hypothetical protein [Desulfobacterales bacterium]